MAPTSCKGTWSAGQAVDPSFGLAQQPERPHGPLPHPGRELGPFHDGDQLTDMPVTVRGRAP